MKNVAIIGGGPAALMLAAQLDAKKYQLVLYDRNKALGRKFLVAGDGGLNLTYNSTVAALVDQYYPSDFMAPIIEKFTNHDLIEWFNQHQIPTFIGSSNRVFPELEMKPIEVLNKIIDKVKSNQVDFQLNSLWKGWNTDGSLIMEGKDAIHYEIVVFAMGGSSWKVTGSDGKWNSPFIDRGIKVEPFRSANCAFNVEWNKTFINTHMGKPLKNVAMSYNGILSKGELVITTYGLEGNAIYPLSQKLQDTLLKEKQALVHLDLKPTMTVEQIKTKYNKSKLKKVTDILKTDLNLDRAAVGILKSFSDKETFLNSDKLVELIKAIPVPIKSADTLDKAISSLGGVALDEIDQNFQLKKIPNTYVIGEMLDWYAPTGGYLLQACFSMGYVLAEYLNEIG